jgi:hypothetical protein
MLTVLSRLLLVPLGLLCAAAAAALIAVTLGLEKMTAAMAGREGGAETLGAYWELILQGQAIATGLTVLPALAVVIIGEIGRIRSWLFYMMGGGLALAAVPVIAKGAGALDAAAMPPAALWQVLATAGFAAGLVYWAIAGRSA